MPADDGAPSAAGAPAATRHAALRQMHEDDELERLIKRRAAERMDRRPALMCITAWLEAQSRLFRVSHRLEDLSVLRTLGVGAFGRVKLVVSPGGVCLPWNQPFALKCIRKGKIIRCDKHDAVASEKALLERCSHPFIIRLHAAFQDRDDLYLLLEVAMGGSLSYLLAKEVRHTHTVAAAMAITTASTNAVAVAAPIAATIAATRWAGR